MNLNIFNGSIRPVICVSNKDIGWWTCKENAPLLTVGKIYTLVDIEVHDWHSLVTLKEFPDKQFNSVLFKEVEE